MDYGHFDDLTRSVVRGGTRRTVLRLLGGGALGCLVARLGLRESAEAKAKQERKQDKPGKTSHPTGALQAEGKRKGKKRKNKPKPKPPLPPACRDCNDCQMCQDGACVPDPALNGVRCLGSGAACGYCQAGQCAASVIRPCEDGTCPRLDRCCPEERTCLPNQYGGWACVDPQTQCCPGERRCANGCVNLGACCPEQYRCDDGTCIDPLDECCPYQKDCGANICVEADECCPNAVPPNCGECEEVVCEGGALVCQPKSGCCPAGQSRCQEGCCPEGYGCHPLGSCCNDKPRNSPEFHCTCPSGYSTCAGRCCKSCCGSVCCAGG